MHLPGCPEFLADELDNFQGITGSLKPSSGEIPRLDGLDVCGMNLPLHGPIGGDHIVYVDFNRRFDLEARISRARDAGRAEVAHKLELNRHRAGILLADVAGHRITDAAICAMLHQAFLLGASYEMEAQGEITAQLFENINTRFFHSSMINKFFTMVYGEISSAGRFRYISAGHPEPIVFSSQFDCIVEIPPPKSDTPIGVLPSERDVDRRRHGGSGRYKKGYEVNEIDILGQGDILLLYTDGLLEHGEGEYFSDLLERELTRSKTLDAREICDRLRDGALGLADPADDISFVVIKKTTPPLSR